MREHRTDAGSTLIEILVAIGLAGALMAIAVGGYGRWARASEQSGAARELQTQLRNAQQRAITEGTPVCVLFDVAADSYTVYRGECADAGKVRIQGPMTTGGEVYLVDPLFNGSAVTTGVTFSQRGTATPGSVAVKRAGSSKTYVVAVEELTGRVSLS